MRNHKTDFDRLSSLVDDLLDDISEMSEHELDHYIKATGFLPSDEAKWVTNYIHKEVNEASITLLESSQMALEKNKDFKSKINIPNSVELCQKLFKLILSTPDTLPKDLTLEFREGAMPSDNDIKSILEDFSELGLISKSDIDKITND